MKKLTIVRFKPKPEHFDAFLQELKQASTAPDRTAILNSFVMTKDDEVFSIVIRHADFSADLAIQGAQLLRFAVQDSEWLWLSETAEYKTGTSLRGGIP